MIGTRIEASGTSPLAAFAWMVGAIVCVSIGIGESNFHWGMVAALPAGFSIALWLTRQRPFSALITAEGLSMLPGGELIGYGEMRAIDPPAGSARAAHRSYPLTLILNQGSLRIPENVNVSTEELVEFLSERIPVRLSAVSPELESYWQRQVAQYGQRAVSTYVARDMPTKRVATRKFAIAVAGFIVSACWCVAGFCAEVALKGNHGKQEEWLVWFGVGLVGGLLWLLILVLVSSGRRDPYLGVKNPREACLVVGPGGLALVQGNTIGEMQWLEIRKLKVRTSYGFVRNYGEGQSKPGLTLDVGGAAIWVADIYDQPLEAIAAQMRPYLPM